MAIDLACYVKLSKLETEQKIATLSAAHRELFANYYLFTSVRDAEDVHREIAQEFGLLKARSVFLVSRIASAGCSTSDVAKILKKEFGEESIAVTFCNDFLI